MSFSRKLMFDVIAPAVIVCWIAYLAYGAVAGAMGYRALHALREEASVKSAEVAALADQRRRLERIARQLNPKSLDPDLVDEKIRAVLGYVEDADVVIPRDQIEELIEEARPAGV